MSCEPHGGKVLRLVSLLAATLSGSYQAIAQEIKQPPTDAKPMSSIVVAKPMSQLLQEGYDITSFSAGLGGFGYLLRHERSWIMCTVDLYGTTNSLKPYSRCEKLSP